MVGKRKSSDSDRIEALERDKAIEKGIRTGLLFWGFRMLAFCSFVTGTFITFLYKMGAYLIDKSDAVQAGFRAFWASIGGQK